MAAANKRTESQNNRCMEPRTNSCKVMQKNPLQSTTFTHSLESKMCALRAPLARIYQRKIVFLFQRR